MTHRYPSQDLVHFATELLSRTGLEADKSATVARILVEGDLLGHTTHGLQLLPAYLQELESGKMAKAGNPRVLADFPAALSWDGGRLPGPWLTVQAIGQATGRAKKYGTATVIIRRSHHIACLAAYLEPVTEQGLMIILACSDPTVTGVAPYGGTRSIYTPNPIAAAWPTEVGPVMMDFSQSITSLGFVKRRAAEGRKLPGPWVADATGRATDDPAVVLADPPGSLLPTGGTDHGHKGYSLALLVEALTGGLAGHGRADPPEGWSATVYLQVLDPALYGGREEFLRQTSWVARACQENPPAPGIERVRLPGESGRQRKDRQLRDGIELYPTILPGLAAWAEKWGVKQPTPLT